MNNKSLFKLIIIVSTITGAIAGFIAFIPPAAFLAMLLLMLLMAPFIIIYFKHLDLIQTPEIEKCIAYGALSGFFGCIGFSVIFFPIAYLVDLIFKTQSFFWVKVVCQNFVFLIGTIFFTALLCALLNAFTGFLMAYILQSFKKGN